MAAAPSLDAQIAHAQAELSRCEGVAPMLVRAGLSSAQAQADELATQAAIIVSLRRLQLLQHLADMAGEAPVSVLRDITTLAEIAQAYAAIEAASPSIHPYPEKRLA